MGRPREISTRQVINGIFYILKTGCQWRQLPKGFPAWTAVYYYFNKWRKDGTWVRMHNALRAIVRRKAQRHKHPTGACIDSQSVKVTATPGSRGFDAGKKVNGRKRHILVDTMGLVLVAVVTGANVQDRDGARLLLKQLSGSCKKLRKIWADGGYQGQLVEWVGKQFRFCLEVVLRPKETREFVLLPRRWVVERTFARLNHSRRFSKDYERLPESSEALIYIRMIGLMANRLA